ncbi:MAG: LysR substrate-binding domain-containing protein [Paracoccaceae bacterium]|nr:LysR substrate-binding domain-containing protein [Paracoccaceae bacterium]
METLISITLWNVVLLGALFALQPMIRVGGSGLKYAFSSFDTRIEEGVFARRLAMVRSNHGEALALWVPAVLTLAVVAPDLAHPHLSLIATLFLIARLAYTAVKITVSTLFRRLERIEDELAPPIFTRSRGAYRVNEIGQGIILAAERIEQEITHVERTLLGRDKLLQGKVTIAASEVLAPFFLARHVNAITQTHPGLEVQVLSGNHVVSLANGDADLAIRPKRPTDEQLFGRKLTDIRWAVYGSIDRPKPENVLHAAESVGFAGDLLSEKTMVLQLQRLTSDKTALYSNSLILTASLAANSGAECVLPVLLGEQWPGLVRHSAPFEHEFGELWIVCHNDLRQNSRVRVVFDHLIAAAKLDKELFLSQNRAFGEPA